MRRSEPGTYSGTVSGVQARRRQLSRGLTGAVLTAAMTAAVIIGPWGRAGYDAVPAAGVPATGCGAAPAGLSSLELPDPSQPRQVLVYRPPVPDSATLPVVYYLHGLPGDATDVVRIGLVEQARRSAAAGRPYVLVAPDGSATTRTDNEWADAADGSDRLETFVTKTVVAAIEKGCRRAPAKRALTGFSMGGYGALNIGLHRPDLFGWLGSASGYDHVDDPDGVFRGQPALERRNTPLANAARAAGRHVVLAEGTLEDDPLVRGSAATLATTLRTAGADVTLLQPPLGHDTRLAAEIIDRVSRGLSGG